MKSNPTARLLRILTIVCLAVMVCSCRRQDFQTRTFYLPGLKNQECANRVSSAVIQHTQLPSMGDSVKLGTMKFDFEKRVMTVEYDSMKTEIKNIEHAIAEAGFAVNEIPADPEAAAKLPPQCR